jgi:Gp157 protein
MQSQLSSEFQLHQFLREKLKAEFPDADDETLRDTVEGMTRLPEVLAAILRSQLDDQAMVNALRERIRDMQERLARFESRSERKRTIVAGLMERAEIKKLSEPDFTASLRANPAPLIILDEALIPADFWKPQPATLDRRGLAMALGEGLHVPGATLGNGGSTIAVRTR